MDKQIEVGENTSLVAEVLDFISSGTLLAKSGNIPSVYQVTTDLEVAKKYAWEEVYGEDQYTWADLRSEKMSEIWDVIYSDDDRYSEVDRKLSGFLDELSKIVQGKLDLPHKELLDDIVSDLKGCLYSRAVIGKKNDFFENILSIYRSGGWPCGWKGEWPNGQAIVYYNVA